MSKQTTAISIKNRTFKINTFHVETIALKYFNISFRDADDEVRAEIKKVIRKLVVDKKELSAQIIEDVIFYNFLPKNLQKDLNSLAYLQGI